MAAPLAPFFTLHLIVPDLDDKLGSFIDQGFTEMGLMLACYAEFERLYGR